ncbi:hypothetical protein AAG906_026312 [Vitis piasezkii]
MISNMATRDIDKKSLEDTPTLAYRTMINYNTLMTHHSGRFLIQPKRFMYLGESFEAIPKEHETDLTDYDETMCNDDDILWQGIMEVLVEEPEMVKPIRCKWVYKRRKKVDGKVKMYKARLIVDGYSKKPCFDYEETFAPIAMLKSIRILLSIVTDLDYEI